jgi:phenylalanyl-tRNA synthetase alpha chain
MISETEIQELEQKLAAITSQAALKTLRDEYFGPSGVLKRELQALKTMEAEERKVAGPKLQEYKARAEELFSKAELALTQTSQEAKLREEAGHLSFRVPKIGHIHPLSQTIMDMNAFFARMGYSVYDGPEIETDEFNFQRLNVPKDHPAREMQDTIYIDPPSVLLRTHTSAIETRALTQLKPPFRIVCPGRVYRNEKPNKSNHFIFHHYEGMVVQERTSLADMFGTLELLFKHLFGDKVVLRFRSKYYPQVEPGVGPDMRCFNCEGKGCAVCKHVGWIEMGGGGIIHTKILRMAGIDPQKYMGFAFGLGLDRWVMARYNITDIRTLLGGSVAYPYYEHEKFQI